MIIPMIQDRFRLLTDWPKTMADYVVGAQQHWTIPAGSIISFGAIKINKVTRPEKQIEVILRVHPTDNTKTMKQYGGKAPYRYHTTISIEELRDIEMEIVKDMP